MLGQLFLASCLVMMTLCWRIDVSEKNVVMQLSLNVTLDCRNHDDNNNNLGKFKEITKLRILKHKPNNYWLSLAKVERDAVHAETLLQNVRLTGNASNLSNSFLKLQFPFATDDLIGQFVCEVEGYYGGNNKKKHLVKTKTEPVVITQREATSQDMLKVILQLKQENANKNLNAHLLVLLQKIIDHYDKVFEKMNHLHDNDFEKMNRLHDKDIEKMNHLHDNDFEKMNRLHDKDIEKVNERTNQLTEDIKSIAKEDPFQIWPSGTYSLLRSGTQCPYSLTFDWQFSSVRITTKPGSSNNDRTSNPSHLSPNTLQHVRDHYYANIVMCSKNVTVEGPAWPKGYYCIHFYNHGNTCPTGLNAGYLKVGRYNYGSSRDVTVNLPNVWVSENDVGIWYCCRKDGNANTPIELPTRSPFYLYRYGGTCQKVKGMDVSNEWIELDSNRIYDKYSTKDYWAKYCPDSTLGPFKLELCYYKPSV